MKDDSLKKDFTLAIYDAYRNWIKKAREKGKTWEEISFACTPDKASLEDFLNFQAESNFYERIGCEDWEELVRREKLNEEKSENLEPGQKQSMIHNGEDGNKCVIPSHPFSSWMLYKNRLKNNDFDEDSINDIESATFKILKRLQDDTKQREPVKGLVIGNVQSGKTANMAALMAMAADNGWNLFIILSGTIDNLRKQTENRLFDDLNESGNLNWSVLKHLSRKVDRNELPPALHFKTGVFNRYFTVCLKNPTRLKDLIQWLQFDENIQAQMKILVIDDEADQAGINTADISDDERTRINRLICNLVNGKTEDSKDANAKYEAMNYVGYTATPYANILNEAELESLYPRDFITTLPVSKEYFGPQQIFGINSYHSKYDGLNIIREISKESVGHIQRIHKGMVNCGIPQEFDDSICWFLCGAACLRFWKYKKPISMLVHTSQNTEPHAYIAYVIKKWFELDKSIIIQKCKNIWEKEISTFTRLDFMNQYRDYKLLSNIKDYPNFSQIKNEIEIILNHDVTNIPLDRQKDELKYHEGVHLCIDNCKNNGVIKGENDSSMIIRLIYPSKDKMPSPAPVFIVVGGSTLSRGLTIEGLISTFFLRAAKQADSLMQMGRWFGYRRGFELIPRIWLTDDTRKQFEFLSILDQELREEIESMEEDKISPSEYGPRVVNSPKLSFLRITAKNKMQEATIAEMDFSGSNPQTYLFDYNALKDNLKATESFIASLGMPENIKEINKHAEGSYIWRSVDFSLIRTYLREYKFPEGKDVFNDIEVFCEWVDKLKDNVQLEKWNVVLVGKNSADELTTELWQSPVGPLIPVTRSQKSPKRLDGIIDIGALRDPFDMVKDIDLEGQTPEVIKKMKGFKSRFAKSLRRQANMGKIPQLLVYIVDRKSKARDKSTREDLNLDYHIAGICLNIPDNMSPQEEKYKTRISIDMSKYAEKSENANAN